MVSLPCHGFKFDLIPKRINANQTGMGLQVANPSIFPIQGIFAYWMTSNTFSLGQMFFLRIQSVRTFFGIPKMADHSKMNADSGGFMENFKAGMCVSIKLEFPEILIPLMEDNLKL